jgi:pimeloyl-ACP methyl ester carboxylesterase
MGIQSPTGFTALYQTIMTTAYSDMSSLLPDAILSCFIAVKDLEYHFLDCPPEGGDSNPPLIVLLHGFPELAFSWRNIMKPLSMLGYRVVAPDQRGYGQTTSQTPKLSYDDDPTPFSILNLVNDVVTFIHALGYHSAYSVIGHDAGSIVAGFSAWLHPDVFQSVVMMSAPFTTQLPGSPSNTERVNHWLEHLARLDEPKKYYMDYFSSNGANNDMLAISEGKQNSNKLKEFLRNYFYVKAADWPVNSPAPISNYSSLHTLVPSYYIMPFNSTMPEAVASLSRGHRVDISQWLSEDELAFYATEFMRTGFQGGLNWYRMFFSPNDILAELEKTCDKIKEQGERFQVPARFIAGAKDWGVYQTPGALEKMSILLTGVEVGSRSENVITFSVAVQVALGICVVDVPTSCICTPRAHLSRL